MIVYLDTGALVKLCVEETGPADGAAWVDQAGMVTMARSITSQPLSTIEFSEIPIESSKG